MGNHAPMSIPALLAPGPLPSRAQPVKLHTLQGVHLFLGQRRQGSRPGYPGLRQFAGNIARPYRLAAQDDPWADWWLIKAESALAQSTHDLAQLEARLDHFLAQFPLVPDDSLAQKTTEMTFHFGTPYGYLGAMLLLQYDAYVQKLVQARHLGLLDRNELSRWIRNGRRVVIRAYLSSTGYHDLGVTRADLQPLREPARAATAKMGALPQGVMDASERSRYAPTIVDRSTGTLRQSIGAAGPATR
ncbi:MAG TPA: TIGR03761 family integrating conjugative element protein [Gammaproteobacteria bacterium]|nr:TIGR03761 family integrating conjugative element protein [Gammaproteobacteria bacterium]